MELDKKIDNIIIKEKKHPTFSHHNINSYLTNLPINKTNTELMNILHYFKSEDNYLNLYQNKEFKNVSVRRSLPISILNTTVCSLGIINL